MPLYLNPEKARILMVQRGVFDHENVPSLETIDSINVLAQTIFDEWLGYNAIPQDYTDRIENNRSGIVVLENYPVLEITRVTIMHNNSSSQHYVLNQQEINLCWRYRDRRFMTDMWFQRLVTVDYKAGLEPLPPIFESCAFNLLKTFLLNRDPWDIDFLYRPTKDVTSVSLGGLNQGFKMSDTKDARHIDRLLYPLQKYRRRIIGC